MDDFILYRHAWCCDLAPHEEPKLKVEECKALLKKGGLLVRNTYGFDRPEKNSFWYIIKDEFKGMKELSSNERNKIRRSLNTLEYKRISVDILIEKGFPILKATFDNYKIKDRELRKKGFQDYLNQCQNSSFDYWGIYDRKNEAIIGFCTVHLWKQACEYGLIGILPEYKHNSTYPYYGLFYSMNEYYLNQLKLKYVSDGSRSITEHSNIQPFLIQNFKFRKAYCELNLYYVWWMKITVAMLYPLRKIITLPRTKAILNMEAMKRGEK